MNKVSRQEYGTLLLTPTEIRLLRFRCKGLYSKEIAIKLGISMRTVETHFSNAMHRNKCKSPFELVAKFIIL
jgi:DNA-binding CsgD family transcriptional regulator